MNRTIKTYLFISIFIFVVLLILSLALNNPALTQNLFLPLVAIITATLTWFVNESLDKPRLEISIVHTEFTESSIGDFTLRSVASLIQYLEKPQKPLHDYLLLMEQVTDLGLDDVAGLGKLLESGRLVKIQQNALKLEALMAQNTQCEISDVENAVKTAKTVAENFKHIQSELKMFLTYTESDESKKKLFIDYFNALSSNESIAKHLPQRISDESTISEWKELLSNAHNNIASQIDTLVKSANVLEPEIKNARKISESTQLLLVKFIVTNTGKSPLGIHNIALLEATTKLKSQILVNGDYELKDLIVEPKRNLILEYTSSKNGGTIQKDWETAVDQYKTTSATCYLKIITLNDNLVISKEFPFYSADTHTNSLIERLHK